MDKVGDFLRLYEDEVLVPLVEDTGLTPVRDDIDFVMQPGMIVVLMNNADSFTYAEDLVRWCPLSVIYSDNKSNTGTVFSLTATFDPKIETTHFQKASISGVVDLVRRDDCVVWVEPNTGRRFKRFPLEAADKILMNAWYLFQGAILPMLFNESYRFVSEDAEKFAFQRVMIRQIHELYEGAV